MAGGISAYTWRGMLKAASVLAFLDFAASLDLSGRVSSGLWMCGETHRFALIPVEQRHKPGPRAWIGFSGRDTGLNFL